MTERTDLRRRGPPSLPVPYPAKISLPTRRPAIIHRPRLMDTLLEGLERRLTVVSAPAGYGKTTLLLEMARTWGGPVCWYSLDERDRDLPLFLRYLVASGQAQFPGFGQELARALERERLPDSETLVDLLVKAAQEVEERFVIVLDDFHFLDEAPEAFKEVLAGWLYRLPENCHLILSGRTWPDLGVLPLMSARQEVARLGARDFAFTCQEVAQLFREVLNKEISLDDAQHLADVTEGWAAALVLMADKVQAARTSISLERLRGSDPLFQYIELEQFKPLPADLQEFLLAAAVPRLIEPAFLDELPGTADAEERLTRLERLNLVLGREEGESGRYRFHKLFRAFLVSRLRTRDPQGFRELNLRAAALWEEAKRWEEAVYHRLQAGDWDGIVQVTERVGRSLFEQGQWDTLAEWLEAVPPEELASQPRLILWKARILHYLNQTDQALALLAQAIQSFEAAEDWVALAEALVIKGMALRVKGSYQEAKEALTRARALLLQHDGPTSVLTEARKQLGITLGMCGEFDDALPELKGALEVYEAQGDAYNIGLMSDQLGTCLAMQGRLAEAVQYLERARQRWTRVGNDVWLVQTLTNLASLYLLLGDYGRSQAVSEQALEKARLQNSPYAEAYILDTLAAIKRDTGQYEEAIQIAQRALELTRDLEEVYVTILVMDGLANAYRLSGALNEAEATVKRALALAEERAGVFEAGICAITMGLIQRERGQLKEAVASLERATSLLKESSAKRELAKAYFHLAEVYFAMKRKRFALDCLEMVARLVQELGYDHFLLLEARRAPFLVQYAAANKLADGYFGRLVKALKGGPSPGQEASGEPTAEIAGAANAVAAYGFGNVRVEMDGREVSDLEWRSEKSKEMFFFFLCNRRPLRKEEIVAALWPELPEEKTSSAFHSNLYRLRQALYPECIVKDSGRYLLNPQGSFWFDVEEFQRCLEEAEKLPKDSPEATERLERALSLYRGPFARDFYSEWAESLRWQLEERYLGLLATLAAVYSEAGEYKRSADLCQRILEVDEYNEAAWYRLMSNYIRSGQMEAAKYCYNRYAEILAEGGSADEVPEFDEICRELTQGPNG